jgi:hypothetical protein
LRDTKQEAHVKVIVKVLPDGTPFPTIRQVSKLPRHMRVSKEAYHLSAKFYELAFSTRMGGLAKTWFNFESDCLVLREGSFRELSESLRKRDARRLKYLTIPLCYWVGKTNQEKELILCALSRFKYLRKLYLMAGDSKEDEEFTKDIKIIYAMEYLVKDKFEEVYGKGAWVPEIEQQIIPALQAKHWGIDALKYGGGECVVQGGGGWDGGFTREQIMAGWD